MLIFTKISKQITMKTQTFISTCARAATLLLSNCGNKQDTTSSSNKNQLLIVEYKNLNNRKIELPLSHFIEDFRIVRLDNSDEALFKAWTITPSNNYIGIRQSGAPFKLFDKDGKFLCDVGRIGQGPGEYEISIYDEIIDEKGGRIFLAPFFGKKIMVYGLDGKWIKDIPLKGQVQKPKMRLNEDGTLSIVHMSFSEAEPLAFCIDMEGEIVKRLPVSKNMIVQNFDGEIFSYQNGGEFDFFHTANDTLWTYNNTENRLEARFAMYFPDPDNKPIHIYLNIPQGIFANCYYWDVTTNQPGESSTYFIDRQTGKGQKFDLMNDFFGNLPASTNFNKGYNIQNFEPMVLKEKIKEHIASGKCPDKDKEKLKSFAKSLNENDNNLLFIGKLKK